MFTDISQSLFEMRGKNHPAFAYKIPMKLNAYQWKKKWERFMRSFKDLIEIDYIHLKEMDASASGYIVLENKVVHWKPLSKFDLGIIRSNQWVK